MEETLTFSVWPFKWQFSAAARAQHNINACHNTVFSVSYKKRVHLTVQSPRVQEKLT